MRRYSISERLSTQKASTIAYARCASVTVNSGAVAKRRAQLARGGDAGPFGAQSQER